MSYVLVGLVCIVIGYAGGIYMIGLLACKNKSARDYILKKLNACADAECKDCN